MGFNLTEIINKSLGVQEQSAYDFVFVPPRNFVNVVLSNFSVGHYAHQTEGFKFLTSATNGGYIHFRFSGRRIGIMVSKANSYGILNFSIDGTDYGSYDSSFVDDYTATTIHNVPIVIATDLPDGEHVLTITKSDTKTTIIQGFLVDNAGTAQTFVRAGINYHEMLDTNAGSSVFSIGTTESTLRSADTVLLSAVFTNTTSSPITVTLKRDTTISMIFTVPANDIRQISGPIYFPLSLRAVASATGVIAVLGVQ